MPHLPGTWALQSWTVTHPMGDDLQGVICYSDDGFVHVHIMCADRTPHASPYAMSGTAEEDSRSTKSHISYSGRWHIEGDRVIHDVAISSFPNWAPSRQERIMDLSKDRLILSTDPMAWGGQQIVHRLVWTRAT